MSDGTWNYSYDANGNLTGKTGVAGGSEAGYSWTYQYNDGNQLISAVEKQNGTTIASETYQYDGLGERVGTTVGGTTTQYAYLPSGVAGGNLYATLDSSGAVQTRYVYGNQTDQVFASDSATSGINWLLTDNQGSVKVVTDGSGSVLDKIVYDAYGNITSQSNSSAEPLPLYAGYLFDRVTGYYHAGVTFGRDLNTQTLQWLEPDPNGLAAGDNVREDVGDDPVNATDPTGHEIYFAHSGPNYVDRAVQGKNTLLSLIKGAVAEDDGKDAVERFPADLGLVQIQDNRYRNQYPSENGFNFIGVTEFDKINLDDLIGVNDFNATNHQADLHYLGTIFAAGRDTSARGQQRGGVDVFAKDEGGTITYNRLIEEPQPSILQRLVKGLIEHAGGIVSGVVESGKNLFKLWDLIKGLATKIRSAVPQIITAVRENPEGFIRNLVTGVAGGFEKFLKNLGGNLTDSVIQWVTDNLKLPSIELPKEFNVEGIVTFLLQFFGLTPDNILNIVVNKIGPQNVALITKAYGFISKAVENPQSVIDLLKDNLFGLSPEALVKKGVESAASYVGTYVAAKAAQEVAGIFTGGAIFTKIYNALDFVVNKGHQLVAVVDKVVDGLLALAQGQTGGLSDEVVAGLKLGIKPLLSLVASALGVPKLADQVGGAIGKVSGFVTEKLDKYIGLLVDKAKGLLGLDKPGTQGAPGDYNDLASNVLTWNVGSVHHRLWVVVRNKKAEVLLASGRGETAFSQLHALEPRVPPGNPLRVKFDNALTKLAQIDTLKTEEANLLAQANAAEATVGRTANVSRMAGETSPGAVAQQQRAATNIAQKFAMARAKSDEAEKSLVDAEKLIEAIQVGLGVLIAPPKIEGPIQQLVRVLWYPQAIERTDSLTAIIYSANYLGGKRKDFEFSNNFPAWWDALETATGRTDWQRGHIVGAQFGGPPTAVNLVAEYEATNKGPIQRLDNDITKQLVNGPVTLQVSVIYAADNAVVPTTLTFTVTGLGTIPIRNTSPAVIPAALRRPGER